MIFQKREYSWVLDCLLIGNGQDNSQFLSLYSCNLSMRKYDKFRKHKSNNKMKYHK